MQRVGFGFHDVISSGQLINRALSDLQNVRAFVQTAILTTLEILLWSPDTSRSSPRATVGWRRCRWCRCRSGRGTSCDSAKGFSPPPRVCWRRRIETSRSSPKTSPGVHVVKAFATEKQEISKYKDNCDEFRQRTLKRIRLFADFNPVIRAIASASHLSLFLLCAIMIIKGKLQIGDFLILGTAMGQILARLQAGRDDQ